MIDEVHAHKLTYRSVFLLFKFYLIKKNELYKVWMIKKYTSMLKTKQTV